MVEFGLKLEDNKVSEWSDKYIDYEKLKVLLKKSKTSMTKRDDLMKRRPELAEEIANVYRSGKGSVGILSPYASTLTLDATATIREEEESQGINLVDYVPSPESERSSLVKHTQDRYGSQESLTSERPLESVTSDASISSTLKRAVTGYFSSSKYEKRVREALREVDNHHARFEECLLEELDKVNAFYDAKVEELEKRLRVLVESVDESSALHLPKASLDDEPVNRKMGRAHRRKRSLAELVVTGIQNIVKSPSLIQRKTFVRSDSDEILDGGGGDAEHAGQREEEMRESDSVQRAIVDQYRTAKLLHNFSIMNYTGFVKIVKKHDKTFPEHKGSYNDLTKESKVCHGGTNVEALSDKMERIYAQWFCDGSILEARAQMLPKRGDGLQMDWSQLRLGYRMGMCAVLGLWVCWDCVWGLVKNGDTTIGGRLAFPVFRGCGGLMLLHWFWGISVYVWTRYRINYIFLFDFDPRIVESPLTIFNDAVDETFTFLVCMLLYYKSGAHDIPQLMPAGCYAFIVVLFTIKSLIFPLKTRIPMWRAIWAVLSAPFTSPTFFTIYIADVFTSMVKVFQDIAWALGFVISGDFLLPEDRIDANLHEWQHSLWYKNILIPLICLFPLWIRFNQCLRRYLDTGKRSPNLPNAFKYAMSQTVTLFGAFHPLYMMHTEGEIITVNYFQIFWMALFVASSLYSFIWDVVMDWGLGQREYNFLGPRLMFPNRGYYYGVILVDLVLRFMWVLTLVPPQSGAKFELPQYLTAVTMALELFRRTIWGFFRLENEHRNNTGHYRRVSFVPLHFNTGHTHSYKREKEHIGWSVLAEVGGVSLLVICVSITSIIAAQRATRQMQDFHEL